jgi:hypothetical protein
MKPEERKESLVEEMSGDLIAEIFAAAEPQTIQPAPPKVEEVVEEKETPTLKEEKQIVEEIEKQSNVVTSDYSKKLSSLIEDGLIEDFSIDLDGEEVYISDLKDLDKDGYQEILRAIKEEKDKELKTKYISADDIDEDTKKIIEIRKNGGDITQLIQQNLTTIDQLTQIKQSIDEEQTQINVVVHALKQQGVKPAVINAQIQALIDDGELETEANTILDGYLKVQRDIIEEKRQSQLQEIEKEKEEIKNTRKELSSYYKEMKLPESMVKTLVDNATKFDQDKITNTDKLYFEAIKDPKKLAEINLFLNNPDAFKKHISSKDVLKTKLEGAKKALSVRLDKTKVVNYDTGSLVDDIINSNK